MAKPAAGKRYAAPSAPARPPAKRSLSPAERARGAAKAVHLLGRGKK